MEKFKHIKMLASGSAILFQSDVFPSTISLFFKKGSLYFDEWTLLKLYRVDGLLLFFSPTLFCLYLL